ncbi:MAG: hypothetical protein U1F18_07875 [Steroidobacteraceae bacterium]
MDSGTGDISPVKRSPHVNDRHPGAPFVFVNGKRAKEADTLPNRLRVNEITPEGAVPSFRASRLLLLIQ